MSNQTSNNRYLTDAEVDEVNGGVLGYYPAATAFAYGMASVYVADALLGGHVADAARQAAWSALH
jgi:DNA-binding beta-propeller fold protein YncE